MKLTIITINRNNAEGLRKTIESVVSQTCTNFEYIVIDGASTDNSVEVVKEYADKITYWVSEPDKGIYNAMNKGILKANGAYLLFLNSGDWLVDDKVLSDFYQSGFEEDVVSGNMLTDKDGDRSLRESVKKSELTFDLLYSDSLPHPATFIKRKLFFDYGLYNEKNRIVSDWEFFLIALVIYNCSYNHFDRIICVFDLTGLSSQSAMGDITKAERLSVFQNNMPLMYNAYRKIHEENRELKIVQSEYYKLKYGKFSFIIRFFLWLKILNKL
jgi:glycosyltransferase involved in cell wall biosynthesis